MTYAKSENISQYLMIKYRLKTTLTDDLEIQKFQSLIITRLFELYSSLI